MQTMTIAVTGMGGAQGAAIAKAFSQQGHAVRRISKDLMLSVQADALIDSLRACDTLVITSPVDHRPGAREAQLQSLLRAAHQAGVGRIIFNTAANVHDNLDKPVAKALAHLRRMVQDSPIPSVIVQPTVYLDNLLSPWIKPALLQNATLAYPAPAGAPIAWMSHQALGQFVVAAAQMEARGQVLHVGGSQNLTAQELCDALSRACGKAISYYQVGYADFAGGLNAAMGEPTGTDIADYYRHLDATPNALSRELPENLAAIQPETAAQWAARQDWTA